MRIDLDAAKAARMEAAGEPHIFVFGGKEFELPHELPVRFGYLIIDDVEEAMRCVLDGQADEFWALEPSNQDISELLMQFRAVYGIGPGESSASAGSSTNGGSRSRPTSPAATRSTSAKRASARRR